MDERDATPGPARNRRFRVGRWLLGLAALWMLAGWAVGCAMVTITVRGTETVHFEQPRLSTMTGSAPASRENVRRWFGEPDSIEAATPQRETWHYRDGLSWQGVVVVLVAIPVPALVPTGFDRYRVTFENDLAVSVDGRVAAQTFSAGCVWGNLPFQRHHGCYREGALDRDPRFERGGASLLPPL